MHNLKDIISMPVLSLYEGELVGQISKVYFDKRLKKIKCFVLSSEGDLNYLLYPKNIYKIGKNAITIKNVCCLILDIDTIDSETTSAPISSKVYSIQGEYLGKIQEITFDEKYLTTSILLDNNNLLDCTKLASCSKNTVIMYDENTKINMSRFKHKITANLFKPKNKVKVVSTLPVSPTIENIEQEITLPTPVTNNPKFLVGRIATQDILLDDKKTLIKTNSTITDRTLSLAMTHNKLKELMFYSRQK